jgi:hypothetical protein
MGVAILSGDATKPEPVHDKYYVNTGYVFELSGSVPIPGTRIFGANFHYFSMSSSDEVFCAIPFRDEDWLVYDPNGQYGIEGFLNGGSSIYWYTSFVSAYPMYELRNAVTVGPSLWLPISKSKRVLFYISPLIGKAQLVHGLFEHFLEETFFIATGNPKYRVTKMEEIQSVGLKEISSGFLLSAGKRFNLKFNFGYLITEEKNWKHETRFFVDEQLKDVYYYSAPFRLTYYQMSFSAGIRF